MIFHSPWVSLDIPSLHPCKLHTLDLIPCHQGAGIHTPLLNQAQMKARTVVLVVNYRNFYLQDAGVLSNESLYHRSMTYEQARLPVAHSPDFRLALYATTAIENILSWSVINCFG